MTGGRAYLWLGGLLLALGLAAPARARAWMGAPPPNPAPTLDVIPFPGTPDASPSSPIIFSALNPSELDSVTVSGSSSGRHAGRLVALPERAGTEFAPDRGFTPGELVRVSATVSAPAQRSRPATRLSFSFRIAIPMPPGGGPTAWSAEGQGVASRNGVGPTQHFRSEPDLHPPVVDVTADPDHTSGDIFLAMQNSPQVGPMIINPQGQLVWFDPIGIGRGSVFPSDLAVQHYHGHPVLTWWQGRQLGAAEDVIMNRSYHTVAVVHAGDGYQADFHEFQITPQGTALLDAVAPVKTDLTSVGGPRHGTLLDDVIQEVDIKTGRVLWEWHALGHVPLSASYMPYSSQQPFYDYFHLNSIQQLPDGNLLISARHTWAVYEISRRTGDVIWTLGGKYSNFAMGPGTNFEWQHDARLHGRTLSLFDDGAYPAEERQSSAKFLRINLRSRTVALVKRFTHSPPLLAGAAGSTRTLPDGNVFVGWGELPVFSEYTPAGRQIFNGTFALGVTSYRAFRFPWIGRPSTRPSLAVSRSHGLQTVYASWNGATQVRAWRLLGGPTTHALKALGISAPRRGFETRIRLADRRRYVAVQALGANGRVLGTSAPARG